MNIHRALDELADIRAHLTRTEVYRGFRSAAVWLSAGVVVIGCACQWQLQLNVSENPVRFLLLWLSVACLSAFIAGVEMVIRGRLTRDPAIWRMHRQLTTQLLPSILVGLIVTLVIALGPASTLLGWALPGLWSVIYGSGLMACSQRLPRSTVWVGTYFMITGILVTGCAAIDQSAQPWMMLVTFGLGQAALGSVLFFRAERNDG